MNHNGRTTGGFSFSSLLIIGLGIIFLLNNFEVLPWEIWFHLWKFWPVLFILFGLENLIGKRSSQKGLIILLVLIFLVPIILILNPITGNPLATRAEKFDRPLGNLIRGQFNFELQSANVKIKSLPNDSTAVFKGEIKYPEILPKPILEENVRLGEGVYTFRQPSQKSLPFLNNLGNNASFELSPLIPLVVRIKAVAGITNLDLEKIKVDLIEVEGSANQVEIAFAKDYSTKAFMKVGAGLITLKIPREVAASIKTEATLKNVKIDESRFSKNGNIYKSSDFETNQFEVEVEISGQATSLEVK